MKIINFIKKQIRNFEFFIGKNIAYVYMLLIIVLIFVIVLHFLPSQYAKGYEQGRIDLFKRLVHQGY